MFEELAYQYADLSEANPRAVSLAIIAVGAVIAAFVTRSKTELRRAPYFALSGLLFLLLSGASMFTSAFIVQAIVGGIFWVIVALEVLATIVFGFFLGRVAMARSRDAYGHGRAAVLAFIPLANLWLLLTPSKTEVSANRVPTIPLLTGGVGVFVGFVMLAAGGGLTGYSQMEVERMIENATSEGVFERVILDRVLKEMAAEVATPMIVDDITTLLRMEADGDTIRYVYEISSDPETLSISMRAGLVQQNCTYDALRPVIEAGAIIEHLYLRRDLSEVGTVTITRTICGAGE